MQAKHLIVLALIGIVILLGFNVINSNRYEQDRAAVLNSAKPTQTMTTSSNHQPNNSIDIASQPLGKQPKAIIDNATTQINQAQQANQERLQQTTHTQ